jgi:NADH:ubiquinone oxidoreductase subunit
MAPALKRVKAGDRERRRAILNNLVQASALPKEYFAQIHDLLDEWLLRGETEPVVVIDGSPSKDQVADAVRAAVQSFLHV